ncbi:MAG: DUF748 domain-containing protein [Propionivibrio sp.]|nr:DUF748 domain-containing protein [Propionivibrio sp.]
MEAPVARLNFDKEGRHSFSALLERLIADEPESQDSPLPRFVVSRLSLSDGRLEISDEFLDEPLVAHIEPLSVDISNLSSLHAQPAHYRLSVRTRLGETLDASGELTLDPFASNGEVALGNLKAVTLAASLSRLFRLDSSQAISAPPPATIWRLIRTGRLPEPYMMLLSKSPNFP